MSRVSAGWIVGMGTLVIPSCATHVTYRDHRHAAGAAGVTTGGAGGDIGGGGRGGAAGAGLGGISELGGDSNHIAGRGGALTASGATAGVAGNEFLGASGADVGGTGSDQCTAESDCPGSCQTCSDGKCVVVTSADDPDSCAGTCDSRGTCKSKRGQTCTTTGNGCLAGSACAPDGYCCDTDCSESCQACDISGFEGTCRPVLSGNPHGNRSACTGESTCGGSCTGRSDGKCTYPTSECGNGPGCSGSDFVGGAKCSDGACVTPEANSCDNGFACVGSGCKASCTSDSDCRAGYFCQAGGCHLAVVAIATCSQCSAAVLSDGSVYAWGYNSNGVVGPQGPDINGPGEPIQNSPVKVTGLGRAKTVVGGNGQVCALLVNGEVWCWGSNIFGELGDGEMTTNYNPTPVKVSALPSGVTALSGQQSTTCALVGSSGDVYCWGQNPWSVLGSNASGDSAVPVKVAGLGKVTQVSMADHACAIVGSTLDCWGNNEDGECGQPVSTNAITPPMSFGFGLLGVPQQVAATGGHTCALLTGGTVFCWGWNPYGSLGDPGTDVNASVPQPVAVAGLGSVSQIASDAYDNCAILTNRSVWCWGSRRFGALGDGKIESDGYSVAPLEVGGVSNAVGLSMDAQHTCVLIANGSIKCWGQGAVGQLGNSLSSNSAVAVDVTATW